MLKRNCKLFIGILIGLIISASGVYATETIIESINVSYDNSSSGGKYTTVQESIDELYEKSGLLDHKWVDPILNGADPVFDSTNKLIPVTIDSKGKVKYANLNTEWYNYSEKRWANAIILVDNPKNGGEENHTYKTGDIIDENDIESYFVWIPRFSYKIWDMGNYNKVYLPEELTTGQDDETSFWKATGYNEKLIDIKFGNIKTNPKMLESAATLNEYYTHPAFTLGNKDLNGIWVGKFETGYNQDGKNGEPFTIDALWTTNGANVNANEGNRIIVKPNVYSWRNNYVNNIFLSSYNYQSLNGEHNTILDPHMMKNTEWGVVTYLSYSAYGIGNKVNVNNSSDYKTGYSATANSEQKPYKGDIAKSTETTKIQPWNSTVGYLASTTGNITGIYDMAGGASEFMAACMEDNPNTSNFTKEELANYMNLGYIDRYVQSNSNKDYKNRILGDATGEFGPFYNYLESVNDTIFCYSSSWYASCGAFAVPWSPWFTRGGSSSVTFPSSQFRFETGGGSGWIAISSRLVLSPK